MKIVQLGNPLPMYDSPLAFAEEVAMIDMISEGRLVSGIVRGAGQEAIAVNANRRRTTGRASRRPTTSS